MAIELLTPEAPPLNIYSDLEAEQIIQFESQLRCGGVQRSWFDRLTFNAFVGTQRLPHPFEMSDQWKLTVPYTTLSGKQAEGRPSGTALFLKSDIDAANRLYKWGSSDMSLQRVLQWLNYTLGSTCGVGLGYVESGSGIEPHIRFSALPSSKMRGAIGWMYGPPLGRNRTMQLSLSVSTPYYILRLIQHEFGHFLGHYGSSSHSGRREDIMYPSLQHVKARAPHWGKSQRDVEWEVRTFGPAWITE